MESTIRSLAMISVFRGCAFGALAIITGMVGLSFDITAALRFGGMAMLLMTAILILKAWRADSQSYKQTEVWIMLDPEQRPPAALAPLLIASARQAAFYRFAYLSAVGSSLMLAGAELAVLLGSF